MSFFGHESALPLHGFESKKSPKRALWLPRVSRLLLDLAGPPACLGAGGGFRAAYSLSPVSCLFPFSFPDLVGMGEKEVSQVSRRGYGPCSGEKITGDEREPVGGFAALLGPKRKRSI